MNKRILTFILALVLFFSNFTTSISYAIEYNSEDSTTNANVLSNEKEITDSKNNESKTENMENSGKSNNSISNEESEFESNDEKVINNKVSDPKLELIDENIG
ncbi:MAG: hypothetical protein ACTHWZ_03460 [Peptoniphilaceae bacterium]